MSRTKTGRGRPRGSGLNDTAQLAQVAKLLRADPNLKPTTAIKKSGVTDPSAVRRLRDKLNAVRPDAASTREEQVTATERAARTPSRTPSMETSVAACLKDCTPAAARPDLPPTSQPAAMSHASDRMSPVGADWLAAFGGLGIQAFAASMEFQLSLLGQAFRLPPVTAALRQQLLFNELTLALCAAGPEYRKTLH